jgi:hypothetical protein
MNSVKDNSGIFQPGQLVRIRIEGLTYTPDGYATITDGLNGTYLYEKISLESYPSANDFSGRSLQVFENDIALIVSHLGRPYNIKFDPTWFQYDVYEILVRGSVMQVFRQNISTVGI